MTNTLEGWQIEPMVQDIVANIKLQRGEKERQEQEATEKALATRRETIVRIGTRVEQINQSFQQLWENAPTLVVALTDWCQKSRRTFLELSQIAVSDAAFAAYVGLEKIGRGDGFVVVLRRQPFAMMSEDCWYPAYESDYDHVVQNYELALSKLADPITLAGAILEKII